ncbi:MAG: tetratricopeptide repeat protein [Pseudomonadota bacterium]
MQTFRSFTRALGAHARLLPAIAMGLSLGFGVCAAKAQTPSADAWVDDPMAAFAAGTSAYYSGDVATALQALESAAEGGHAIARWKLARMYAVGDGVDEDDVRAFTYYSQIANAHAEDAPGTARARFVANAFVALGSYYQNGIGDILHPDQSRSREIYAYAASYFGDPDAQYRLGMMHLHGEGGGVDIRRAGRWLRLSALKGHVLAQVELGELLFTGADGLDPHPADGLKWLLIAGEFALTPEQRDQVRPVQERYLALANTDLRARALQMADEWLTSPEGAEILRAHRTEQVAGQ